MKQPVKDAIDAELEFHVEMLTRRYINDGMDPAEARERARRRFGDTADVKRTCHALVATGAAPMTREHWFRGVRQDVAFAWRLLRRAPLFTATAVVTIALGIGATTAIFSVVNDVLLRRLPYPSADRVVLVWNAYRKATTTHTSIAAAEFADLKDTRTGFDAVAALQSAQTTLVGGCVAGECEPERVAAYIVSPNLFDLLMATPQLGRLFTDADGVAGATPVVIVSDALWRRRFGTDRSVVGRTFDIGGRARVVVGVMPPGVRFPDAPLGFLREPADVWLPFNWEQRRADNRGNQNLAVVARMRSGVPMSRAQTDLDALAETFRRQFAERYARPEEGWGIEAIPLRDQMVGDVRPELLVLLGAVGIVLLIACANVANLLLARGSARATEFAVRTALGAGRTRLVRQLLIEAGVLTAIGGAVGIAVAAWGMPVLVQLDPAGIPRLDDARLDSTVLAFSLGVMVVTTLLLGLTTALRQSQTPSAGSLADGSRGGTAARVRRGVRGALVMTEVALAIVVLAGAGLLVRSFAALARVEPGFDASRIVTFQLTIPRAVYDSGAKIAAFNQQLVGRLAAIPGITNASAVYPLPMSGDGWGGSYYPEGYTETAGRPEPHAEYGVAMPGYFQTVRIPIVAGRDFGLEDHATSEPVVIVDEVLARTHWPGESAVGKRLNANGPRDAMSRIVGVVGHVRRAGPREEGEPQIYLPALQSPQPPMYYTARTNGDASALVPAVREAVRQTDARLALAKLGPMPDLVARVMSRERFSTVLLTIFGAVALLLAAVGLYGVMAFLVEQRTREIGIRLALGGQPSHVLRRVMAEGLTMTAIGVGVGLAIAVPLARLLKESLFEIGATDPLTYAGIAALLIAVSVVATYVPARRAMRVDPVEALRT
jgi:putative ABC transport system permease protein